MGFTPRATSERLYMKPVFAIPLLATLMLLTIIAPRLLFHEPSSYSHPPASNPVDVLLDYNHTENMLYVTIVNRGSKPIYVTAITINYTIELNGLNVSIGPSSSYTIPIRIKLNDTRCFFGSIVPIAVTYSDGERSYRKTVFLVVPRYRG